MVHTLQLSGVTYEIHTCITCGCIFVLPELLADKQRKSGGYHSCFNGHSQGWSKGDSVDEQTRRERDSLKQQLAERDDRIAQERKNREIAERQASAARGQVTRLKNRAKAGLCSCCNRHFTNLERHMATKHLAQEPTECLDPVHAV